MILRYPQRFLYRFTKLNILFEYLQKCHIKITRYSIYLNAKRRVNDTQKRSLENSFRGTLTNITTGSMLYKSMIYFGNNEYKLSLKSCFKLEKGKAATQILFVDPKSFPFSKKLVLKASFSIKSSCAFTTTTSCHKLLP